MEHPVTSRPQRYAHVGAERSAGLSGATNRCNELVTVIVVNPQGHVGEEHIIERMSYQHPVFNTTAFAAQKLHDRIDGVNRTHFCGAYWGYGFHEDGLQSALGVCQKLEGETL